jgi:myo-inositol-1-phosphate synthase
MGAVATTAIAGVLLARRGLAVPIGSITQLSRIRVGGADGVRAGKVSDVLPLARLDDLVFAGWDIFAESALLSAEHAQVLDSRHIESIREELGAVQPMSGAFYSQYVRGLQGTHVKSARSKAEMVELLREDIRQAKRRLGCARAVAIWCGSTEVFQERAEVHRSVRAFEYGLAADNPAISNAQLYAWACIKERVPFANGAPNLCIDFPAAWELAREHRVPLAGKDFKTGQTMIKTALAPAFKRRMLGVRGWYSTNILGNRDGEVLRDAGSFRAKEVAKLGVLESILDKNENGELYGDLVHEVRIDYYPPRGDAKEGWDNVDLVGFLGYPMQLKVNFLGRDSILAAPLLLDVALLLDLAQRADLDGPQEWLSFFFKSPMCPDGGHPEHDLFVQSTMLDRALRWFAGEEPTGSERDC